MALLRSAPDFAQAAPLCTRTVVQWVLWGYRGVMTRPEVRTLRDAAPLAGARPPVPLADHGRPQGRRPCRRRPCSPRAPVRPSATPATTSRCSRRPAWSRRRPSWPATGASAGGAWSAATRWSRQELTDPAAVDAALEAEALARAARRRGCATGWPTRTPTRLGRRGVRDLRLDAAHPGRAAQLSDEVAGVLRRWADRTCRRTASTANRSTSSPAASRASREPRTPTRSSLPRSPGTATSGCCGRARGSRCSAR